MEEAAKESAKSTGAPDASQRKPSWDVLKRDRSEYHWMDGSLKWTHPVDVGHLIEQLRTIDPTMKVSAVTFFNTENGTQAAAWSFCRLQCRMSVGVKTDGLTIRWMFQNRWQFGHRKNNKQTVQRTSKKSSRSRDQYKRESEELRAQLASRP